MPQTTFLKAIELLGTKVAPAVRRGIGVAATAEPPATATA
jgi:hypothetical protein